MGLQPMGLQSNKNNNSVELIEPQQTVSSNSNVFAAPHTELPEGIEMQSVNIGDEIPDFDMNRIKNTNRTFTEEERRRLLEAPKKKLTLQQRFDALSDKEQKQMNNQLKSKGQLTLKPTPLIPIYDDKEKKSIPFNAVGNDHLGGGPTQIIKLLSEFNSKVDKEVSQDIKEVMESPIVVSKDTGNIPVLTSRYANPEQQQEQQQQNLGSLEEIISRHDAANERQTQKLIEQFNRLAGLIEGRVQGSKQESREIATGTGEDTNVLARSIKDTGSGNDVVNESVSKVDLSKLTSDTYAQTVRYLKLFRAIIEKRHSEEGAEDVIKEIDTALKTLLDIVKKGDLVKVDETTQDGLKASNGDVATIMFALLGIGVTSAGIAGGKRKRKTLKRMKYKRGKKGRNTKKRARRRNRT
jgi:hypothetical protein